MARIPVSKSLRALSLCLVAGTSVASQPADFGIEEPAPGVFVHRGAHASLEDPRRADSANIGFIVGQRCVAVIDTGGAIATGVALARAIERRTGKPVCYVINTHVHFDHVLGNAAFRGTGAQFTGHVRLAEAMAANREFFVDSFATELGGTGQEAQVIGPDLLVDGRLELDLGQRPLVLEAHGVAHTNTDLTVLDVSTGTLWTGDLLFRERMPVLDGSLLGWIAWMEAVMRASFALVIPGHGAPDAHWPEGAAPQHRYFMALRDDTRKAVADGRFIEDAKDVVATGERERWLLADSTHGRNVSRAFRELEWE